MTNSTIATGAQAPRMGLAARFFGVITSPKDTFQSVVAHPTWLGMLLLVTVLVAAFQVLPMTSEAGKEAALRQQVEQMEGFGMQVTDQAYEGMRRNMRYAP